MLQYYTFNFWKLYILNNGGDVNLNQNLRNNKMNTKEEFNINPDNLTLLLNHHYQGHIMLSEKSHHTNKKSFQKDVQVW